MRRIVWCDTETTGLKLRRHRIIQLYLLVTDGDLNVIDEGVELLVKVSWLRWILASRTAKRMHEASNLRYRSRRFGLRSRRVDEAAVDYLRELGIEKGTAVLAGNNIAFDRAQIRLQLPWLNLYLHYRSFDVSTVKTAADFWMPEVLASAPPKRKAHTAKADLLESLVELRHYKVRIFDAVPWS